MSSYKQKLYRSHDGCCICRAKSSSSRFTDSTKYEEDCTRCFKLADTRNGEICNACVLIVKRWKKLPVNTTKDWAHVVDARTGPGIKNVFKNKKKDQVVLTPSHTFKHKHVYRRKRKNKPTRSNGNLFNSGIGSEIELQSGKLSTPEFLDTSYWRREVVCCGVIYVGGMGEVMLDQRFYNKCSSGKHGSETSVQPSAIETLVEAELISLQSETGDIDSEEFYGDNSKHLRDLKTEANIIDDERDDTFYDKLENKLESFTSVNLIISH